MAHEHGPTSEPDQPATYRIRIAGHLGPEWSAWFDGLRITLEDDGATVLSGPVADQAALHGLLRKVRDLGLPLLSLARLEPGAAPAAPRKE